LNVFPNKLLVGFIKFLNRRDPNICIIHISSMHYFQKLHRLHTKRYKIIKYKYIHIVLRIGNTVLIITLSITRILKKNLNILKKDNDYT
jgi:hypothetical protein